MKIPKWQVNASYGASYSVVALTAEDAAKISGITSISSVTKVGEVEGVVVDRKWSDEYMKHESEFYCAAV